MKIEELKAREFISEMYDHTNNKETSKDIALFMVEEIIKAKNTDSINWNEVTTEIHKLHNQYKRP